MYLGQMTCSLDLADKYTLQGFQSVEIKKSVHQIAQTAKIKLPISVVIRNHDMTERIALTDKIKEGDKVSIAFGYDRKNNMEFNGYINAINYKSPLEIECEDQMYLFRNTPIKLAFNNLDIRDVLVKICSEVSKKWVVGFEFCDKMPAMKVKNFIANGQSALWALQQIKDWYPMLGIFFTELSGKTLLYCGLLYQDIGKPKVKYALSGNQNNTVSIQNLKYQNTSKPAKVIWEIRKPDGTIQKKEYGDSNAELIIKKKISGNVSDDVLKQMAEQEMLQKNYVGYTGKFSTFLFPYCDFGTIGNIADAQFPDRQGNYFIGSVTTKFDSSSGGRREPEIDFKLR